jgi:hypothetical protein
MKPSKFIAHETGETAREINPRTDLKLEMMKAPYSLTACGAAQTTADSQDKLSD